MCSKSEDNKETDMMKSIAETARIVLDFANTSYSSQWTKFGNVQTSASSLLTIVSIVASAVAGVLGANKVIYTCETGKYINYAFIIAISVSVVYMFFSCIFLYFILETKKYEGLSYPKEIFSQLLESLKREEDDTVDVKIFSVTSNFIDKIDKELKRTDGILNYNRYWYGKCLPSSFFFT